MPRGNVFRKGIPERSYAMRHPRPSHLFSTDYETVYFFTPLGGGAGLDLPRVPLWASASASNRDLLDLIECNFITAPVVKLGRLSNGEAWLAIVCACSSVPLCLGIIYFTPFLYCLWLVPYCFRGSHLSRQ